MENSEIYYHSTCSWFDKVKKEELQKRNNGYLGKGFYMSDAPEKTYGNIVLSFSMPKGKELIITNEGRILHANIKEADDLLQELKRSTIEPNAPACCCYWPGFPLTSKSPKKWNELLQALDIDIVKCTVASNPLAKGIKYPEILVPENKIELLKYVGIYEN